MAFRADRKFYEPASKLPRDVATIARVLENDPELLAGAEKLPSDGETPPAEAPDGSAPTTTPAEAVDGPALLRDIEAFISRFIVLPPGALLPLALWTLGTHLFDSFEAFPYVALVSPEKGCGKTRTTEVLEFLVSKPVRAVCLSEAALFRLIEAQRPTLILDEAEVITGKGERAEAVRAVLNAGNRVGASVPRCVGSAFELRFFSVYSPKVLCGIRKLPETISDRSLVISMQRKGPDVRVGRFIPRRVRPEAEALRARIESFAQQNRRRFEVAYQELDVDFLHDRELENYEPLLAILTVADASRLGELRGAAERLADRKLRDAQEDSLTLRLLADMRAVWPEEAEVLSTADLLTRLKAVEAGPWAEEVPLNPRKLARMLRPFGVTPGTVRVGNGTQKGYDWEGVEETFARYLPLVSVTSVTSKENIGDSSLFASVTDPPCDG